MAASPILPTPDQAITPSVDALIAERPAALAHINLGRGRWANVLAGLRAMAALAIARMGDEVAQRRLTTASGDGLRELIQSEFLADVDLSPTYARGTVYLNRASTASTGVIPAGTRFRKPADPAAVPLPVAAAEYESTTPVVVPAGTADVQVDVRAVQTGPDANVPLETETSFTGVRVASTLFDTFTVTAIDAAGGSNGTDDAALKVIAKALARGQFGPTRDAVLAGALLGTSVRYAAIIDNLTTGKTKVHVADVSWGSSTKLLNEVTQRIRDDYSGFGLLLDPIAVTNIFIRVSATVRVRDARYLSDTTEIQENVRKALRAYFDDRDDWYAWKLSAIRGVIARADRRLMSCTTAAVQSRTGISQPEPTSPYTVIGGLAHYYLANDAVTLSVLEPA